MAELDNSGSNEIEASLCIVGAGICGLNALFSATKYLGKNDTVILVDKNPSAGGMWNTTYDYVRLHQPHQLFTVGNIGWNQGYEQSYLASKSEVKTHLAYCLEILRKKVNLIEFYGYSYNSHIETLGGNLKVETKFESVDSEKTLRVKSDRLIKCFGRNIVNRRAMPISSMHVKCITPHDQVFKDGEILKSETPIYIVGGGKTAMDTADYLLKKSKSKNINVITGDGAVFLSRDKWFPKGLKKWIRPSFSVSNFIDSALHFDGKNIDKGFQYFKNKYTISLKDNYDYFHFGVISTSEIDRIRERTNKIIDKHFEDVKDIEGKPTLIFKDGERLEIESGAWVIDAIGDIFTNKQNFEPYISTGGKVLSCNSTSSVFMFPYFDAYFLTHLFFLEKLKEIPLYYFNMQNIRSIHPKLVAMTTITYFLYNTFTIMSVLPPTVLLNFNGDSGRWYPLPYRIVNLIKVMIGRKRYLKHLKKSLNTVCKEFDVPCDVLPEFQDRDVRLKEAV